jgi:hypothetical protein
MKLRAPSGCTGVSHGGRTFTVEADGSLDVESDVAAALAAHGFSPWPLEPRDGETPRDGGRGDPSCSRAEIDIDSLNRPALFALLREKGVRVALPISNAELRAAARRAMGAH